MCNQLTLLAYEFNIDTPAITLLAIGTHENFYRDLKCKWNCFYTLNLND